MTNTMAELLIRNEDIARRVLNLAARKNQSVEELLDTLLTSLEHAPPRPERHVDVDADIKRYRRKIYAEARAYWERVGDAERLGLTDDDLDEQFYLIDGDGVPRLKSETHLVEILPGSGPWRAEVMRKMPVHTDRIIDPADADDILNAEFADYLLGRMDDGDGDGS